MENPNNNNTTTDTKPNNPGEEKQLDLVEAFAQAQAKIKEQDKTIAEQKKMVSDLLCKIVEPTFGAQNVQPVETLDDLENLKNDCCKKIRECHDSGDIEGRIKCYAALCGILGRGYELGHDMLGLGKSFVTDSGQIITTDFKMQATTLKELSQTIFKLLKNERVVNHRYHNNVSNLTKMLLS